MTGSFKTRDEFEHYFRQIILPIVQREVEHYHGADLSARRTAWKDEVTELIKEGLLPMEASEWRFPDYCCQPDEQVLAKVPSKTKVICPLCNKRIRAAGYWQHREDKHGA